MFDLIVRGGTIVDGSLSDPYVANIAIQFGLVRAIGASPGQGLDKVNAGKLGGSPL